MANESQNNQGKEEEKKPPTYFEKLRDAGWPQYFQSTEIQNVGNPNPKLASLGFVDGATMKQTIIIAPTEEWIKVLTEIAKKTGSRA